MAEKYIIKTDVTNHLQEIQKDKFVNSDYKKFAWGMEIFIDTLPTADVEPVVHAKWVFDEDSSSEEEKCYRCSNCKAILEEDYKWRVHNYCYHCGAKMGGEENNV